MDTCSQTLRSSANLIQGDSANVLDSVADKSCKLVLTSPPYNIGKEYERDQRLSLSEYIEWTKPIISKLVAKLSDDGHICWQTGNFVEKSEVFPLDIWFYQILKDHGLFLRNRIVWHFNFGLHANRRLSGRYETILWFSKSKNYTFNLDPIRVPQIYPGKRHSAKKGDKAGKPSGNRNGKNPSDFWTFDPSDAFLVNPIWDFPNVKAAHPEKTYHPCQFPLELAERCVLALTNEGDTVLDPFLGSGTTAIAAMQHNRNAIGIDRDARYIELARERLTLLERNELPRRPLGKPVYIDTQKSSVSRLPSEWLTEPGINDEQDIVRSGTNYQEKFQFEKNKKEETNR